MIQASLAAFLGSYFSVFHAPRMDLFWCSFLPLLIIFIFYNKNIIRAAYIGVFFFIWTQAAVQFQLDARYQLQKKATVVLELEITQLPSNKSNSVSFLAKPLKIIDSDVDFDILKLKNIKINWYRTTQHLKGGQIWRMKIRLQPPHGYQNEGGFDYERWMFVEGISATAYVLSKYPPKLIAESSNYVLKVRSWLSDKIKDNASSFEFIALFQTLSIGDKTLLKPDLKKLFVDTGTAHLLVISGLHVGLLSLLFYFLASRLWLVLNRQFKTRLNQRDFAVIWAWSSALVYAALAGFSLPTLRALIMLSLLYFAFIRRQKNSFLNVFCAALILVLLLQPLSLLSFSFWLSFLAILLIVISQYVLGSYSKIKSILLLQLSFSLLFIPLNAIVFNQLIVSSFFANLVLIPVMSFVVIPFNLLATALSSLDWAGVTFLYQLLDFLIRQLVNYLLFLNVVFGDAIALSDKQVWLMLMSSIGIMLLLFLPNLRIKLPSLLLMLLPWFYWDEELSKNEFLVHFFDVGMGTSVLIKTQHHSLLYDLGPGNESSYQPAKWVMQPYLAANGMRSVDMAIVSHSDQDHYGGIWPLTAERITERYFLTGSKIKMKALLKQQFDFIDCHHYQPWVWDGVKFEFLPIISEDIVSDNNRSCVLKVKSANGSVLLVGDIEKEREAELVENYSQKLKADILLVPHHGSRTSSTKAFLQSVSPLFAVTTTGYLNHWGFPKHEVMDRYEALNVTLFNTAIDGAVIFNVTKEGTTVSNFRNIKKALWH